MFYCVNFIQQVEISFIQLNTQFHCDLLHQLHSMLARQHRLIEKLDILCRSSNKQRLAFAHTIIDEIMDSAEQPLNGRGWWMQEDDPWQVLACCMEIANALKNPDHRNYVSYFPVHQDGSCNGLQHYAALGRDCLGADCVNLTPRENPQVRKREKEAGEKEFSICFYQTHQLRSFSRFYL